MAQTERVQRIHREYKRVHGHEPATLGVVIDWAVARGYYKLPPPVDPKKRAEREWAKALREETRLDPVTGLVYRVNHAVTERRDGEQETFWGEMEHLDPPFMKKALQQRREQIVGECWQLHNDKEVYNRMHQDMPPLRVTFNFEEDIADRMAARLAPEDFQPPEDPDGPVER